MAARWAIASQPSKAARSRRSRVQSSTSNVNEGCSMNAATFAIEP